MNFKYFDQPRLYASYTDHETACEICGRVTKCFDATLFFGTADLQVICEQCLADGKLTDLDVYTCEGDIEELENQLRHINPSLPEETIQSLAKEKTMELEKTTPHLITWQDWPWPAAEGDYCRFIGYGSKNFYQKESIGSAQRFFEDTLYHYVKDIKDPEELWELMNEEDIPTYDDSANYPTLFYVFRSLESGKVITVWDTN